MNMYSEQDPYLGIHSMEQYMASLLRCMAHDKVEDTNGFMRAQFEALVGKGKDRMDHQDVHPGFVEVTLTHADGLPEGAILMLNGPVKAQAPVAQLLQRPWKLPFRSSTLEPFKLAIIQAAGETRIQMNPQQNRYHAQFPSSHAGSHPIEIGLHLRRGKSSSSSSGPVPMEQVPEKREHGNMSTAAVGAHQYLEAHKLVPLTKELLRDLVTDKPQDPFRFLLGRLEKKVQERPQGWELQRQLGEMTDVINLIAAKNLAEGHDSDLCYAQPVCNDADEVAQPIAATVSGSHLPALEPPRMCKSGEP